MTKFKQPRINLNHPDIDTFSPTENLLNKNFLERAVLECLKNNDHEGSIEILQGYIEAKLFQAESR